MIVAQKLLFTRGYADKNMRPSRSPAPARMKNRVAAMIYLRRKREPCQRSCDDQGVQVMDSGTGGRRPLVPHTQVHQYLRRTLETTQDVIVILLMVLLIVIAMQALWRLAEMAFRLNAPTPQVLSQVVFVLILVELYRTLIFYLREHRVSVALMVEIAVVSILRELILAGVRDLSWTVMMAIGWLLLVLGALLAVERRVGPQFGGEADNSAP